MIFRLRPLLPHLLWLTLMAGLSAGTLVGCALVGKKPDTYIEGREIFYNGEIDARKNRRLFSLYEQAFPKPTVLNIFSTGGQIVLGLELGEWVLKNELDVHIPVLCVSACANYVFTTGRNVVLGQSAVIYWHGSPIIDDLVENTAQEQTRWQEVQRDLEAYGYSGGDPRSYWRDVRSRNRRLFRAAGVSPLITVPQTLAESDSRRDIDKYGDYKNWGLYLSVNDMKFFGRDNVIISGGERWQPELSRYHVEGILRVQLAQNFADRMKALNSKLAEITY